MHYKEAILVAGRTLMEKSLTIGTWGNISCRDPEKGHIYITPSGMPYPSLEHQDIVVLDVNGTLVEGERVPSSECPLHLAIYQKRKDVQAVIHTHPIYSGAFGVVEEGIPPVTEDFVQLVGSAVNCARYALPGTRELAEECVQALGENNGVLLTNHGTVCVGCSLDAAFMVCDVVEKTAQIVLLSRLLGRPRVIPEEDIAAMQAWVQNGYGQK